MRHAIEFGFSKQRAEEGGAAGEPKRLPSGQAWWLTAFGQRGCGFCLVA